jgi:hypothetical protein
MEYLVTYGWAILIIGVVIVVLFYSGVLSSFQPKAQPNQCIVSRPDGPGSTQFLSFAGPCLKEPPVSVATFNPQGGPPNPAIGNITVKNVTFMPDVPANGIFAMTGWIYISQLGGQEQTALSYGIANNSSASTSLSINQTDGSCTGHLIAYVFTNSICLFSDATPKNQWIFVAIIYNGSGIITYTGMPTNNLSRTDLQTNASGNIPAKSSMIIGSRWNGSISNVQLYNSTLSQPEIQALYNNGVGGPPIDTQWLVGWWPLNGNANDYSGNGNNGAPFNSSFTPGTWAGYYNP